MGYRTEIFLKVCSIGLLLFQGTVLNLYLSRLYDDVWWCWYVADAVVVTVWTGCLIMASKRIQQDQLDGRDPSKLPDEIKYTFIAWIGYVCCLIPRVVLLFHEKARTLVEKDVFGPNYLKIGVACTPLIFLVLLSSSHNAKPFTGRKYYVASLSGTVTLDLFDSIDLLDFLFVPEHESMHVPSAALRATLVFACINFCLPVLVLIEIRVNKFKGRVASLSFKFIYVCCYIFLVNIPNLVIRSVLWHRYNMDVSVLLMKNIMCICLGMLEINEYFNGEDKPKKCERCKMWFQKTCIGKHKDECKAEPHERMPLA